MRVVVIASACWPCIITAATACRLAPFVYDGDSALVRQPLARRTTPCLPVHRARFAQ